MSDVNPYTEWIRKVGPITINGEEVDVQQHTIRNEWIMPFYGGLTEGRRAGRMLASQIRSALAGAGTDINAINKVLDLIEDFEHAK